jgi:hypothetical protein
MTTQRKKNGYYPVDGVDLVSVTTALRIINKPTLNAWGIKKALEYVQAHINNGEDIETIIFNAKKAPTVCMMAGANIGTMAHKVVEYMTIENIGKSEIHWNDFVLSAMERIKKESPETFDREMILSQVKNCACAFADWGELVNFVPLRNEVMVHSKKHKYAGRFDSYGYVRDSRTFIDFKSGGLYDEVRLQLAAYKFAFCEMSGVDPFKDDSEAIAVRLPRDLSVEPKASELMVTNFKKDFKAFLAAKTLYEWTQK